MIILFPLLLLPLSSADYLTTHLKNNVDTNVDPCDNFYRHACSQSADGSKFPWSKIRRIYENMPKNFTNITISRNLPIRNDIAKLQAITNDSKPLFNRSIFETIIRTRCEDDAVCYDQEFTWFYDFYVREENSTNERLTYFSDKLESISIDDIVYVLTNMVEELYESIDFGNLEPKLFEPIEWEDSNIIKAIKFYGSLTNRLFVMEELKSKGIFEKIVNIKDDIMRFKELIISKFRNTPWMNEEDNLGLILLPEFEDKIRDLVVYYDLDESDRDLELLRAINSNFSHVYYQSRARPTGVEVLDIYFSLYAAGVSRHDSPDVEENVLVDRVENSLAQNAEYVFERNSVAIFAPYIYPQLTNNVTLNKPYFLFNTLLHEMLHSVVRTDWAERSDAFYNGMECFNNHFNQTCDLFEQGSCNSGEQTFTEDGPDVEGVRINYEYLTQNYKKKELEKIVFKSPLTQLSVTREQAFFYLFAIEFCDVIGDAGEDTDEEEHTGEHSLPQIRVNGLLTQMPEFSRAFSCSQGQEMYTEKGKSCSLFGPDSK